MSTFFERMHKRAEGLSIWWVILGPGGVLVTLYGVSTSYFHPIAQFGWAAIALATLAFAFTSLVGLAIFMNAWVKFFRSGPTVNGRDSQEEARLSEPVESIYEALGTLAAQVQVLERETPKQFNSLLQAQANHFKGEISGTWSHINGLIGRAEATDNLIQEINARLSLPPNMGSTLSEVLSTAEEVRLGQIVEIRKSVTTAVKDIGETRFEIVHLLDFALNQLSAQIFSRLITECPKFGKMNPPTNLDSLEGHIVDMNKWVRDVISKAQDCVYGDHVCNQFGIGLDQAESEVDLMRPEERPQNVDVLIFRKYYVKARQCELMREALEYGVREIRGSQISIINNVRRFYRERQRPRS